MSGRSAGVVTRNRSSTNARWGRTSLVGPLRRGRGRETSGAALAPRWAGVFSARLMLAISVSVPAALLPGQVRGACRWPRPVEPPLDGRLPHRWPRSSLRDRSRRTGALITVSDLPGTARAHATADVARPAPHGHVGNTRDGHSAIPVETAIPWARRRHSAVTVSAMAIRPVEYPSWESPRRLLSPAPERTRKGRPLVDTWERG